MSDEEATQTPQTEGQEVPEYEPRVTRTITHIGKEHSYVALRITNEELDTLVKELEGGSRGRDMEEWIVSIDGAPKGTAAWGKVPVDLLTACEEDLRRFFGATFQRRILSTVRRTSLG